MRYDYKDGSYAIISGGDFWARLVLYDANGNKESSYLSERVSVLMDLAEKFGNERGIKE